MGQIVPEAMLKNKRWKIAVPPHLWHEAAAAGAERYVQVDNGNLVAPWSAKHNAIGALSLARAYIAAKHRLCSGCGLPIGRDQRAIFFMEDSDIERFVDAEDEDFDDCPGHPEPPLHLECAGYVARACPHIREERWGAIIATRWRARKNCKDDKEPEFWPDLRAPFEVLDHEAFLARTSIKKKTT